MDNIILLILGVFISFLEIVNIMGNIGVSLTAAFVTTLWSERVKPLFAGRV